MDSERALDRQRGEPQIPARPPSGDQGINPTNLKRDLRLSLGQWLEGQLRYLWLALL
jgi:hypothetical protein